MQIGHEGPGIFGWWVIWINNAATLFSMAWWFVFISCKTRLSFASKGYVVVATMMMWGSVVFVKLPRTCIEKFILFNAQKVLAMT